jgi:hypothetical protein
MNEAANEEQAGTIGRRMAIGGAALAVGSATLLASTGSASAGSNRFKAEDELAIKQLSIN